MFKKNKFAKDAAKIFLVATKHLLKMVNLWPENENRFKSMTFWISFCAFLYIEIGQIVFVITNSNNIAKLGNVISSISVTIQAISKIIVIYVNSSTLKEIIQSVWYEFWPSNVMGTNLEKRIKFTLNIFLYYTYSYYISGVVFSLGLFSAPYINGLRELPYKLWYPFDWTVSPTYEILYILHGFINLFIVLNVICGYDFLYYGMCLNLTTQFQLAGEALRHLGTENEKDVTTKLLTFMGTAARNFDKIKDDGQKLLVICIKHHKKLIRICSQLNTIFSLGHIVQLATTVAALCVSLILMIMMDINTSDQSRIMAYCFGHISQLFLLCAVSHELQHWSTHLAKSLNLSCWYNKDFKKLAIHIVMVTMRSYNGNTMTAMGIINLNYATFIAVLRFSFSLYTLLGTMVE